MAKPCSFSGLRAALGMLQQAKRVEVLYTTGQLAHSQPCYSSLGCQTIARSLRQISEEPAKVAVVACMRPMSFYPS